MPTMTPQYEIRIRGRVRPALLEDFGDLEQSVERVETVLHGPVVDQAALHGLLAADRGARPRARRGPPAAAGW